MIDRLSQLAYWEAWQDRVTAGLPMFASQGAYVEQDSVDPSELSRIVDGLKVLEDPNGMMRDFAHGGRLFPSSHGAVTRMWVDGNVEIAFLRRALGSLDHLDVLDIGAGYGRLAVMLAPLVEAYACVDAVPVSVEVCRQYTDQHSDRPIAVYGIAGFRAAAPEMRPTLAINIHSWNECSRALITQWLDVLDELAVPRLFTVSHGQNEQGTSYRTCEHGEPSFRPLLEARYDLMAEESVGIGQHPHALWRRR